MTILQALRITAPLALRHRCCYCEVKHPIDGRGPILDGELVSDGACPVAFAKLMAECDAREAGQ